MSLSESIDTIESGYEFMLAYAAQGRDTDRDSSGSGAGFELRESLHKMEAALAALGSEVRSAAELQEADLGASEDFLQAVEEDAKKALGLDKAGHGATGRQLDVDRQRQCIHPLKSTSDGSLRH
ncbi:MAG: hypothetical protein CM1200mP36_01270 [Gammaproteobacteria bacterium]|nr:MAG: hypothetical protein CM1200mP36_01270 [Gammaproteobacteria bacterium]